MTVKGIVVPNKRNGTKFGYPTANIAFADKSADGLFAGFTKLLSTEDEKVVDAFGGKNLPSIIFIGMAETVNESRRKLESHILDFPLIDLYGSEIEVVVADKLRDSKKFDSVDELIEQMKQDEINARKWFTKQNNL